MAGLVDITLPSGEAGTVPEKDLAQAVAAGAKVSAAPSGPAADDPAGGLLGQAAAGIFGAGSSATMGLSDRLLSEGSYLLGGKALQKETLGEVRRVREANPLSTMAGEAAGLFVTPSFSAVGEAAEAKAASKLGEGLLGSVGSMAARGAAEGAMLGAQKQITEDALGDHGYNGEAIFASAAKDALLGGAFGGALGAGGYGLRRGADLLRRSPGPAPDAVLDELAGVPGAGRKLATEAKQAEGIVDDLRKTGMTSEQAARVVDDVGAVAKEQAESGGVVSGAIDDAVGGYVRAQAADSPERAALIRQAYANKTKQLHDVESGIEQHAMTMSEKGTRVLRNLEDVANDVQFTEKPQQFARLVNPKLASAQRDQVASLLQDTDDVLKFWEGTASKGGAEGAIRSLRRTWTDALYTLSKVEDAGANTMSRDLFIRTDKLKRALDRTLKWGGTHRYGLPEAITHAEMGLEPLTNRFRSALEDAAVWGDAGAAQARWNASFSQTLARTQHFKDQLGVAIDQQAGIRIPEIDFAKVRGMLGQLKGGETDAALQSVKSTEAAIEGFRDRVRAIREFGDLSPSQAKKLDQGLLELDEFEASFAAARKDAAVANRLKEAVLEERDASHIGGLLGLFTDAVARPLTTVQRLAQVRMTVQKTEDAIAGGLRKFFGGDADSAATRIAEKLAPRAKEKVAQEIGDIASLRGNPAAMEARASSMVGDLPKYAPKTANEVRMTAIRALDYLAREAPRASVPIGILAFDTRKARYSDQQISEWESKRRAALDPESVVRDLQRGRLDRDAIRTVEFVSPKLYAKMQQLAQEQIQRLAEQGKLDRMPYQQRALIATLLKVPADETWRPEFVAAMQAAKQAPAPEQAPAGPPQPNRGVSKRAVEINTDVFATEGDTIEQGRAA